jgi:DNA-binding CsgD family transcriptional regulator
LVNAAAAHVIGAADETALWPFVADAAHTASSAPIVVLVGGQPVEATCEAVRHGSEVVAALLRIAPKPTGCRPSTGRSGRSRSGWNRFGWDSLSDTERVVADLAARGQTNRQIGDALFVSPHTVDSHIRHIYGKLGISSRVELTRLVLTHSDSIATGSAPS